MNKPKPLPPMYFDIKNDDDALLRAAENTVKYYLDNDDITDASRQLLLDEVKKIIKTYRTEG